MSIQFSNLCCHLGGRRVLNQISGEITAGKVNAILGPNGCGKSTWLRALLGLVTLESGNITGLPDVNGYLPQKKEIYWPLTCEAIVNLGNKNTASHSADAMMERLKIGGLKQKPIDEVSGGERTLVLLARALRDKPKLIIADEPIAELDPKYQVEVMRILKEEALAGATVLVTMHDIQLTARFADFVFLMREGSVIKQGEAQSCLSQQYLKNAFGIAFAEGKGLYAK